MFLAFREIKHSATRFVLIVAVITLVSYLTFFLAALANGLAYSYRASIDDWGATSVGLTSASNKNINASRFNDGQLAAFTFDEENASLVAVPVVADSSDGKVDSYSFGIDFDSFLAPPVIEGRLPAPDTNEVIADDSLKEKGWKLGTLFTPAGSDTEWTVVGFSSDQTFQAASVIFYDQQTLLKNSGQQMPMAVNAVISKANLANQINASEEGITVLTIPEFINTLPGYSAQVLTFSLMIGALIAIASLVLGIFIYVLTLQKQAILGVMKARGVPTRYLIFSGAAQTAILCVFGVAVGFILTLATGLALPSAVPFRLDFLLDMAITGGFVFFSLLGGLISVRTVARIDPVEAIS